MSSTPRQHRYQLPLATRSTDVSVIHDCPGRWVLTHFREKDQAPASFFILGTQLHETIEVAINVDLDEDWALRHLHAALDREIERIADAPRVIESSKRGFDTIHDDAQRMLKQWFKTVHPDSPKRLAIYDKYEWPPQTEVAFMAPPEATFTKYPVWGSIDAMFRRKGVDTVALVDWKSGTSRQRNSEQLWFYEFGLDVSAEVDAAWFHHLDKQQERSIIQEVEPWPGSAHVRQRILATEAIKDAIVDGEYPQFNPDWYCGWCPVQEFCPADGDPRNREQNAVVLRQMLRLARPMTDIERVA